VPLKPAAIVILLVSLGAAPLFALPKIGGSESVPLPPDDDEGLDDDGESNDGAELGD
jgi:hypothetical protein